VTENRGGEDRGEGMHREEGRRKHGFGGFRLRVSKKQFYFFFFLILIYLVQISSLPILS